MNSYVEALNSLRGQGEKFDAALGHAMKPTNLTYGNLVNAGRHFARHDPQTARNFCDLYRRMLDLANPGSSDENDSASMGIITSICDCVQADPAQIFKLTGQARSTDIWA